MRPSLALVLLTLLPQGLTLPAARAEACVAPRPGRYAVMGMGTQRSEPGVTPMARLLEERWLSGGRLQGTLIERQGKSERRGTYTGQLKLTDSCVVQLERTLPWGTERSEAVLDGRGHPLYSLNRQSGAVQTERWLPMAPGRCRVSELNGLVLSSQVGLSWASGGWSPNAVVQREHWRSGQVQGLALSSYGGVGETASYTGSLNLDADSCWGQLQEQDDRGQTYRYRTLQVNGRQGARGYLYLQSDPDDLTVGWLVHD